MSDDWPSPGTLMAFRYRLITRLVAGDMAEVWRAKDELLDRPVALKLPTGAAWKEARMAARLSHPNIAAVHDYDEAVRPDGSVAPFMVMELLTGESLAARLERSPLSWQEAARIGTAVAQALGAAHDGGVVHRDVKPGNVMLTLTGVKILDFGISAATGDPDEDETGVTFGTPAYVAPERLDGKPAEPATDVYGLGVLLFEMVTGEPPYPVDTWEELTVARRAGRPGLPAAVPAAFRELTDRCLVEEPDRRPTAEEVRARLRALLRRRRAGGRKAVLAAACLVAVGAVIALVLPDRPQSGALGPPVPATATPAAPVATPSAAPPSARAAPPPVRVAPSSDRAVPPSVRVAPPPGTGAAPLHVDTAIDRVASAVESGRATGEIRADVAVDFLNLIRPLRGTRAEELAERVDELQRKLRERESEGSVDEDRADVLRSRLSDLGTAVGA
jgi:eukaryotic-like serine/threonine-protein kinase